MDASKWIGSRDNETRSCWYSGFGVAAVIKCWGKSFGSIWSRRRRYCRIRSFWMLKPFLLSRKTHYSGRWIFWQSKGIFSALTGRSFYGYEIHSGITNFDGKSLTLMKPIHEAGEISPEGSQNVMIL